MGKDEANPKKWTLRQVSEAAGRSNDTDGKYPGQFWPKGLHGPRVGERTALALNLFKIAEFADADRCTGLRPRRGFEAEFAILLPEHVKKAPGIEARRIGPLPADLASRHEAIAAGIASLWATGGAAAHSQALKLLASEWSDSTSIQHADASSAEAVIKPIMDLSGAIAGCQSHVPPWGGIDGQKAEMLVRDCTYLLKSLFCLLWTADAWRALSQVGQAKRLEKVRSPRFLQAGLHAANGLDFELHLDPAASTGQAGTQLQLLSDRWHLAFHGELRAGAGEDRREQLLGLLGKALHGPVFAMPGFDKRNRTDVLDGLEIDFHETILLQTLENKGRQFMVSERFEHDEDAGIDDLIAFAQRLAGLPLAYAGGGTNPYLRVPETLALKAVNSCLQRIAAIRGVTSL